MANIPPYLHHDPQPISVSEASSTASSQPGGFPYRLHDMGDFLRTVSHAPTDDPTAVCAHAHRTLLHESYTLWSSIHRLERWALPEDRVLVPRHLLYQGVCTLLAAVHNQCQAQRHAPDDLHQPTLSLAPIPNQTMTTTETDQIYKGCARVAKHSMLQDRRGWPKRALNG